MMTVNVPVFCDFFSICCSLNPTLCVEQQANYFKAWLFEPYFKNGLKRHKSVWNAQKTRFWGTCVCVCVSVRFPSLFFDATSDWVQTQMFFIITKLRSSLNLREFERSVPVIWIFQVKPSQNAWRCGKITFYHNWQINKICFR